MSDTPRTDAREESAEVEQLTYKNEAKGAWHFARQLERELAEEKADNARLRGLVAEVIENDQDQHEMGTDWHERAVFAVATG